MRFSIRDLLWATLVVAMGLGWWVSYRAIDAKWVAALQQANRLRDNLTSAKNWHDDVYGAWREIQEKFLMALEPLIGWSALDEPLVEP